MSGGSDKVKPSRGELELAALAKEQWADYEDRFMPVEGTLIDLTKSMNTEGARGLMRESLVADASAASDQAYKALNKEALSKSIGPNSGKFTSLLTSGAATGADSIGSAGVMANNLAEDRYVAGMTNLTKIGRGASATANAGFRSAAGAGAQNAMTKATYDSAIDRANMEAIATAAGAGLNAYGADIAQAGQYLGTTDQWGQGTWGDPFAGPRKF